MSDVRNIVPKLPQWLLVSFLISILFLLLPIPADNIKYIVASLVVLGIPVFGVISKRYRFRYPAGWLPYFLIGFVGLSFVSIFWSTDPTMAIRESFNWLLLALVSFIVSTLIASSDQILHFLSKTLVVFFIFFLVFHLGAIQFDIGLDSAWNALMSRNRYYTTTLLTCLSPFIIFYPSKSQFVRFSKIISVVLLANLLFLTGARGALLAFSLILLLKYWNFYAEWKFRYFGVLVGAIIIVSGIYFLNTSTCLLYTSPSPRDRTRSRMPSSA